MLTADVVSADGMHDWFN